MVQRYNDPPATPSTIGPQAHTFFFQKQALIEARREQYFTQLADTVSMPKHMGKKIKRFHYLPLLDDANINDQGIDANGNTIDPTLYTVELPGLVSTFAVEANATSAAAAINAIEAGVAVKTGASTPWTVTSSKKVLIPGTQAQANAVVAAVPGARSTQGSGNLYGSTKDIGSIPGKFPILSETGGRVNRVGFKRKEIEGSLEKLGFFEEYTQESMDFDSDADLWQHINREMLNGASEISEDMLQLDLIGAAGIIKYAGDATQNAEIDGTSVVTYSDLMRLSIDLDNNRTPKFTKMITGTRLIDTRTIPAARVMYIGSEMLPTFKAMKDLHNNPAFISVEKYAAGGNTLLGEVGAVDQWRIIVVPEMMKWAGAGAAVGAEDTFYDSGTNFDVFPLIAVGDSSFTTIGFQTDGQTVKFKITHKKPGTETADRNDPYGETGFMSIKWYYGFMALRSERIALLKSAAKM